MQIDSAIPPLGCQRILAMAERDPRRAAAVARRLPRSSGEHPWHDYTLGRVFLVCEEIDQAEPRLIAAAERFRASGPALAAHMCDYALLQLAFARGSNAAQVEPFMTLASQFDALGARAEAFRARVQLALLYDTLGRAPDADTLLAAIAPERPHVPALDQARWHYAAGAIAASARSDLPGAIEQFTLAERLFGAARAHVERAKCAFQQAWAYLQHGQMPAAERAYLQAERAFTRFRLPIRLALLNRGLGYFAMLNGRYDEALRRTLTAQRQFEALGRTNDVAQCLLNLGNLYYYTGWWPLAITYYDHAAQLFATLKSTGWELHCQRNHAMVLYRQGRLAEALVLQRAVKRAARAAKLDWLAAETRSNVANTFSSLGEYQAADDSYDLARRELAGLGNAYKAADTVKDHGWSLLQRGDSAGASRRFAEAEPLLRDHPGDYWRVRHGLARSAELRGEHAQALEHYRAASRIVAGLRKTLALEAASSALFAQASDLYADALGCAARAGQLETLLAIDDEQRAAAVHQSIALRPLGATPEMHAALVNQQRQIDALEADETLDDDARFQAIRMALASYSELLLHARHSALPAALDPGSSSAQLDLPRLRAQLDKRHGREWTALVFARSGTTLFVLMLTPNDLLIHQTPWDAELAGMVRRATHEHMNIFTDAPFRMRKTTRPWDLLHRLAERLLPPALHDRLNPDHRLLITPADDLHQLPWGALRLPGGWLAERAVIQQVPALTIWSLLAERAASPSGHALLLGCSEFGEREQPLPATRVELDRVAQAWRGPHTRWQDAAATRDALLKRSASGELQHDALLHLATHGSMLPEQGQRAHLELWDGGMWIDEIASLRLGGALVTISACDGAGADTLPGNEVLSLSWAFLVAGARAVLASLWPISDAVAPELMSNFYTALHRSGDAAQALAETQRAMIAEFERDQHPRARPLTWASFVLTGAP